MGDQWAIGDLGGRGVEGLEGANREKSEENLNNREKIGK